MVISSLLTGSKIGSIFLNDLNPIKIGTSLSSASAMPDVVKHTTSTVFSRNKLSKFALFSVLEIIFQVCQFGPRSEPQFVRIDQSHHHTKLAGILKIDLVVSLC